MDDTFTDQISSWCDADDPYVEYEEPSGSDVYSGLDDPSGYTDYDAPAGDDGFLAALTEPEVVADDAAVVDSSTWDDEPTVALPAPHAAGADGDSVWQPVSPEQAAALGLAPDHFGHVPGTPYPANVSFDPPAPEAAGVTAWQPMTHDQAVALGIGPDRYGQMPGDPPPANVSFPDRWGHVEGTPMPASVSFGGSPAPIVGSNEDPIIKEMILHEQRNQEAYYSRKVQESLWP